VISPQIVKELRTKTGAGFGDCKKALDQASGDLNEAEKILKEMGLAQLAKRATRTASEGRIFTFNEGVCVILEISCETDFVAKNEDFINFGNDLARKIAKEDLKQESEELKNLLAEIGTRLKENINIKNARRFELNQNQKAFSYVHGEMGSIGSAVVLESDNLDNEAFHKLGEELCLHIVAFNPLYIDKDKIKQDYINEQKAIFLKQMEDSGKSGNVLDKIIEGKLNKHFKEICFLDQEYIKDDKNNVRNILKLKSTELNSEIKILDFAFFSKDN